jgi:hypothetical protein
LIFKYHVFFFCFFSFSSSPPLLLSPSIKHASPQLSPPHSPPLHALGNTSNDPYLLAKRKICIHIDPSLHRLKKNTINLFCCPQLSQRRRGHRNQHNLRQGQNRTPHLRTPPPKLPSGSNYRKFNTRRSLNNHVSVESSVQVSMMHNIRFPGPGNPVSAETKKDKCLIVTVHPPLPPPFRLHPSTH